jgi:hypothetical protein
MESLHFDSFKQATQVVCTTPFCESQPIKFFGHFQ